jgi:hypothetical protein
LPPRRTLARELAVLPSIQPLAQTLQHFSEVVGVLCDDRPTLFNERPVH